MENNILALIATNLLDAQTDLRRLKDEQDVREAIDLIFDSSSSSSSSSSEFNSSDIDSDQTEYPQAISFEETIVSMNDTDFKSEMHLERSTVDFLISIYSASGHVPVQAYGVRNGISFKTSVYIYIWYVTHEITFYKLAELFKVSTSAALSTVRGVTSFLISISHKFIKWPRNEYIHEIVKGFKEKTSLPGVMGVIDCTHIAIKKPKQKSSKYLNENRTYSITLQAIVDCNKKFLNVTCGEPGSLNNFRVLRRSQFYELAKTQSAEMFGNSNFIIGHSAYPYNNWLVAPFTDDPSNLTDSQRKFNDMLSSTQMFSKNAFQLLKRRFPMLLKFTEYSNLNFVTNIVASTCVLHNICIDMDDLYEISGQVGLNTERSQLAIRHYNNNNSNIKLEDLDKKANRRGTLFNNLKCQNTI